MCSQIWQKGKQDEIMETETVVTSSVKKKQFSGGIIMEFIKGQGNGADA